MFEHELFLFSSIHPNIKKHPNKKKYHDNSFTEYD